MSDEMLTAALPHCINVVEGENISAHTVFFSTVIYNIYIHTFCCTVETLMENQSRNPHTKVDKQMGKVIIVPSAFYGSGGVLFRQTSV